MKIATIMSVYRGDDPDDFLRSIESICDQKLPDSIQSRIYLAIDGPVSGEIMSAINSLKDKIYHIEKMRKNEGLSCALNRLIDQLQDEDYIFRMDSDDLSLEGRYISQIQFLESNPLIDIVGTDIIEFDRATNKARNVKFARTPEEAIKNICWRVPVAHPTVCFRRSAVSSIGHYPNVPQNEDIALWFKCLKLGLRFGNVPMALYQFKIDDRFWRRRSFAKAFYELRSYLLGIYSLYGFSFRMVLPMARFVFRLLPASIQRAGYDLNIRKTQSN